MAIKVIATLVLTTVLLHFVACAPQKRFYPATLDVLPQESRMCVEFNFPLCNRIGYNTTSLPNKRNHNTWEKAAEELQHFERVITSKCSDYVATLFCFTYFPFCDMDQWVTFSVQDKNNFDPIYPCRNTCKLATDGCRVELESRGYAWPLVFDCDNFPRPPNCAGGPDPEALTGPDKEEETDTTNPGDEGDDADDADENGDPRPDDNGDEDGGTSGQSDTSNEVEETDPPPTREPAPHCTKVNECDYRTKCTSNFFKKKDHNFAAKVIFTGEDIRQYPGKGNARALIIENLMQYNLSDRCSHELAPPLEQYDVIYTNTPEGCGNCFDIVFGEEYLIAGHYDSSADKFELRRQNALLSPWVGKYENAVFRYIEAGNKERLTIVC